MSKNINRVMAETLKEKMYKFNIKSAVEMIDEFICDCVILNENGDFLRMETQEEVIDKFKNRSWSVEMVDYESEKVYLSNGLTVEIW